MNVLDVRPNEAAPTYRPPASETWPASSATPPSSSSTGSSSRPENGRQVDDPNPHTDPRMEALENARRDQPILESADRVISEIRAARRYDVLELAVRAAFRGQ